jgi:hypothetical protein
MPLPRAHKSTRDGTICPAAGAWTRRRPTNGERTAMKPTRLNLMVSVLLPAALLTLPACSSTSKAPPPPEAKGSFIYVEGVPGGIWVQTVKATADVIFVDKAERKVTLRTSDGKKTTVTAPPEVRNFDQIRVGDRLNLSMAEELVLHMAGDPAPKAPKDGAAAIVALAPIGAKPGIMLADAVQVTATITAIDHAQHKATLSFPDGTSETFPVRPDVDLTKRRVGEQVTVRSTMAVAIMVEGP